ESNAAVRHDRSSINRRPHDFRARHFAHEVELFALPAKRQREVRSRLDFSVMFDERSSHSHVQEESAFAVDRGKDWARKFETLKLAAIVVECHKSGTIVLCDG